MFPLHGGKKDHALGDTLGVMFLSLCLKKGNISFELNISNVRSCRKYCRRILAKRQYR